VAAASASPVWGILAVGATRMRRDVPVIRDASLDNAKVPWDWTDFLMFWPGWFSAFQLLGSVAVIVTNFVGGSDPTVRNAIQSTVLAVCQYAGMLFNIFVLGFMRRGGTLRDLGWRGFKWWWLPAVPVAAYVALVGADYLQQINQSLFPGVSNGQCVTVRHDYSHYYWLAIIVVCVIAPISEETIFRGFIYGWLRRWGPCGPGGTARCGDLLRRTSATRAVPPTVLCGRGARTALSGVAEHPAWHPHARAVQPAQHHPDPEHELILLTGQTTD